MEHLFDVPGKWKVRFTKRSDGVEVGGWVNTYHPEDFEERENFVFKARLRFTSYGRGRSSTSFSFKDADGDFEFSAGPAATAAIFEGLAKGSLVIANGCIEGLWTFKKQGSEVYLFPHEKPE